MRVAAPITTPAPASTRIPFQPDVPIEARPFADAIAFSQLDHFGGFGPTNVATIASAVLRAADANRDGRIDVTEASTVAVRDRATTPHRHDDAHILSTFYVDAAVTYDAMVPLMRADASGDGTTTGTELEAYLVGATGLAPLRPVENWDPEYRAIAQAFHGAVAMTSLAHGEVEHRMPW